MQKAKEERELREAKKAEAVRQAKLAKNPGLTLPAVVSTKKEEKDAANAPKPKKKRHIQVFHIKKKRLVLREDKALTKF